MLPLPFLSKMGIYNVRVNGSDVKARVVDNDSVVELALSELLPKIQASKVVGITVRNGLLMLCAGSICLVFQWRRMDFKVERTIKKFLTAADYCLVSSTRSARITLENEFGVEKVVELADLAARILKRPSLLDGNEGLKTIGVVAAAVGLPFECRPKEESILDWNPRVLSQEQVEFLAREAHMTYLAGKKLLESL